MDRMNLKSDLWIILRMVLLAALVFCLVLLCIMTRNVGIRKAEARQAAEAMERQAAAIAAMAAQTPEQLPEAESEPEPEPTPEPTAEPTPTPLPDFDPAGTELTKAENMIYETEVIVDGETLEEPYLAAEDSRIDFSVGSEYTEVKGIITFRGNNFRDTAQYGLAEMTEQAFGEYWKVSTNGLNDINGGHWTGSGWTGQPLVVEWPESTRKVMNMYEWAKEKDGLVEVIWATMDGNVYFFDLETGSETREPLYLGYTFKGAGALDPRGYPILYVGGGVTSAAGSVPRIMVVSLIDGEVLYTIGNNDSYAPRWWSAYDSSPLVDAETDQLIYPGENGLLYIIKLNTQYDEQAGTLSVEPGSVIRWKYGAYEADSFRYGMEASPVIWRSHLFIPDNSGDFFCLDLDTLTVDWCVDILDDTNCTPLLELDEDGHPYLYISTSFRYGLRGYYNVSVPVWKIDAETGETVWMREYECYTEEDLSGGSQASFALGTGSLDGILYVAMARTPTPSSGLLLALDSETGEEIWTYESGYAWSTPTCFYDTEGNGYVLYTSCIEGSMYMLDGLTGDLYDSFYFGVTMEASPVVYDNRVVIGTRRNNLYGIELK